MREEPGVAAPLDASELGEAKPSARGLATKSRVIAATIDLLDEHGEQGLRIAEVSRRSGVSIGSIYHHFGGRDGLIKAARTRQFRASIPTYAAVLAELAASSSSASEFVSGFRELIRYVHARERAHERFQRIVYMASAMSRPDLLEELREQQTELITLGSAIAETMVERGWVKDGVSARALATFSLALELGAVVADFDNECVDEEWWQVAQMATAGLFRVDSGASRSRGAPRE
jgi:AcrR family transcriptional regulator